MVLQMSMAAICLLKLTPSGLDASPNESQPPYRNVTANGLRYVGDTWHVTLHRRNRLTNIQRKYYLTTERFEP